MPNSAVLLASSSACVNQAFQIKNNVIGIQFHLEVTQDSISSMLDNSDDHMNKSQYVQNSEDMLNVKSDYYSSIHKHMKDILQYLTKNNNN